MRFNNIVKGYGDKVFDRYNDEKWDWGRKGLVFGDVCKGLDDEEVEFDTIYLIIYYDTDYNCWKAGYFSHIDKDLNRSETYYVFWDHKREILVKEEDSLGLCEVRFCKLLTTFYYNLLQENK